ncbi:putative cardiolipin-specific deacylase, mitochondrial [Madurella mycetomatis]|uniref:Cardiolipin-specific deacylase, mitochondrial n=1 Tax=Madurella mycetomatis TaxID=100816 RepID=A0A175WFG2_9PEZI|nr:putative cardiolipin-specific deacylase, mitochondrial [Madurella mycetomatis]
MVFSSPPDPNNQTDIIHFMRETWRGNMPTIDGTTTVSDTFTIKGTYCVPANVMAKDTLQVLVHGITYNKSMWAGMGFDSQYNWHHYANTRGYATLALDRLGHGENPQVPDPLTVVQPQMHVEILHQIFSAARSASSPVNVLGRAFDKVVFVGHSYGSFLGAALGAQYPADADALVLTGYSSYLDFTDVIDADWVSATVLDPARFANLPLGYVTMANETQRATTFFVGDFDAAIPPVDFAYQDTLTVGEIGGLSAILGDAVAYTGPVLVATTVQDAFFCEEPAAQCEAHLAATAASFPNASDYDYFAPDNTGHDLTLHYSAQDTFEQVHDWLDAKL